MHKPYRSGVAAVVLALCSVAPSTPPAGASVPSATFAATTTVTPGAYPQFVELGDLNGDTVLDLVVAELYESTAVSVFLGDGSGGFGPRAGFGSGHTAWVRVGDLNSDGNPDLVYGPSGGVTALFGDGTGSFGSPVVYPFYAYVIDLADMNGDDALDLVTSDAVRLGDGTGAFGAPTTHPNASQVADLNGDSLPDLVAVTGIEDARVTVFLANGDGTFGAGQDLVPGNGPKNSVTIADLDGDSIPDIISTNAWTNDVSVQLGDGTGSFGDVANYPAGFYPETVAVGDLNGDAVPDLAVANPGTPAEFPIDGSMSVLLGTGDGGLGANTTLAGGSWWSAQVGDLDGDGRPDIVGALTLEGVVGILRNTTPLRVPGPPLIGVASAGHGQATVSWTPPAPNPWSPVTGYVVTPYVGYFPLPSQTFGSTATTQVVTGLTNGTQYRFRVQAINAIGTGGYSQVSNAVTLPTVPGAPMIGSAVAGNGQATVSWTPPASNGGAAITGYVVTPYVGYYPLAPRTFSSTATTQPITGLTNGTQYRFRVQATNAIGTGGYSTVTAPVTPTP